MNEKYMKRITVESLTSAAGKDIVQIFHDTWWVVDKDGNVLFSRGTSAQCNRNKEIAQSFVDRMYPDCEIKFIPVAFIPVSCGDFDYEIQ